MPVPGTKLRLPRPRRTLVQRARLASPFLPSRGPSPRLVLLAAPPGFGKTTLLTQWLTAEPRPARVAWATLDDQDADVRQFLTTLVAALGRASDALGVEARALLGNDRALPVDDILASLVDDLDAVPGQTVIALDDYHRAGSPPVHEAVGFLVDNLPPRTTMAITTRADPPLALARLRARGELIEVRAADLRFTEAEAGSFLGDVMGLHLDAARVGALESRTEGWVAGLQLAALAARAREADGTGGVGEFVDAFSGSHRFVVDYLVEEVLDAQPEATREFLLLTSVLEQLSGPLCDAVTGLPGGQQRLDELERANLFLAAADDHRLWYRSHQLFADALRARLAARWPERVPGLHLAASQWYVAEGFLDDALHHAALAGDAEWLAVLLESGLRDLRARRVDRAITRWMDAVPDGVLRRRPVLATTRAWTSLSQGDVTGAAAWLDTAERTLADQPAEAGTPPGLPDALVQALADERRTAQANMAIYRAALAQAAGDQVTTIRHAQAAEAASRPTDHFVRGAALGLLGLAEWGAGDVDAGASTFRRAITHLGAAGNLNDQFGATVVLALMALAQGDPGEARRLYEDALRGAASHPAVAAAVAGDLHVGLADVLREQGDLAGATEHLEAARALGESAGVPENRFRWHTASAGVLVAQGDPMGAVDHLDRAETLYRPGYFPDTQPLPARRARAQVLAGHLGEARRWAEEHRLGAADAATYAREYELLTYARLVVAEQRARTSGAPAALEPVLQMLVRIEAAAAASGRGGSLIEVRLVRALVSQAAGRPDRARAILALALADAVPRGYCRLFLDEGPPLVALLRVVASSEGESAPLAERLLQQEAAARAARASRTAGSMPGGPVPPVLSERELSVMKLLATDLTGPEIANHLYVSINTLRTHTKNIFTKLDVRTRRAAVHRAQELGLV